MFGWSSQPVATVTNVVSPTTATCGAAHKIHAIGATTNCDNNNNEICIKEEKIGTGKQNPKMTQSYLREEDITEFQREKIEELRKKLGSKLLLETPIFDDDFSLLRWLIGWNYKIEEIIPKFEKASHTLRALNVVDFVIDNIDELNIYIANLTIAAEYYPGGLMGFDQDGNVISMQMLGGSHPKKLVYCGQTSDAFKLTIIETALIYQLVKIQERKYRRKLGLRIILDMDGFNSDHLYRPPLKTYANILKQLQCLFPDLSHQVHIINAPVMVMAGYKLIQSVLSENTRKKVMFCGSDYRQSLIDSLGGDCLFERWGGFKRPTVGHPITGTLRMGGIPPAHKAYNPEKNPFHVRDSELKRVCVSARSKHVEEVEVSDGHYIHWFFLTNGDVEFSILNENGYEVHPQLRLTTDFVPEYGILKCCHERKQKTQKYKIIFDNSFSKFFSKEVKFYVQIRENVDKI